MLVKSFWGCFKDKHPCKQQTSPSEKEIYRTEIHPAIYIANKRAICRHRLEESLGTILLLVIIGISILLSLVAW